MAEMDVEAAIGLVSGSLLEKMLANSELCSNVMALTAVLAIEMKGSRASAVNVGDVEMVGLEMRAHVTFQFRGTPPALPDLPGSDHLLRHIGQENRLFYDFLRAHPDVVKWLRQVVEKMETHALQKGVPYSSLSFGDHGAFVDRGNTIVLKLTA